MFGNKDLLQWLSVWFVIDSRHPPNSKAGRMGHNF